MMPQNNMEPRPKEPVDYKKKYKALKKKMRLLVNEQECFVEELRKAQRKLLKLQRDKSFLLDRLLQFEKVVDDSDDSDATASSDSDMDTGKPGSSAQKKKTFIQPMQMPPAPQPDISSLLGTMGYQGMMGSPQTSVMLQPPISAKVVDLNKKKPTVKVTKKMVKASQLKSSGSTHGGMLGTVTHIVQPSGHVTMTREELERHLEMKTSAKPKFMSIEATPHSLPDDIFNHDNSNSSDVMEKIKEERDLVIDMPQ